MGGLSTITSVQSNTFTVTIYTAQPESSRRPAQTNNPRARITSRNTHHCHKSHSQSAKLHPQTNPSIYSPRPGRWRRTFATRKSKHPRVRSLATNSNVRSNGCPHSKGVLEFRGGRARKVRDRQTAYRTPLESCGSPQTRARAHAREEFRLKLKDPQVALYVLPRTCVAHAPPPCSERRRRRRVTMF